MRGPFSYLCFPDSSVLGPKRPTDFFVPQISSPQISFTSLSLFPYLLLFLYLK